MEKAFNSEGLQGVLESLRMDEDYFRDYLKRYYK